MVLVAQLVVFHFIPVMMVMSLVGILGMRFHVNILFTLMTDTAIIYPPKQIVHNPCRLYSMATAATRRPGCWPEFPSRFTFVHYFPFPREMDLFIHIAHSSILSMPMARSRLSGTFFSIHL
jgi:hypothetical protein